MFGNFLNFFRGDKTIREEFVPLIPGFFRLTYHWGLRPNSLIFAGVDGILISDPGQRSMVSGLHGVIRKIDKGEVRYIINTHGHGDHISANGEFADNIPIIGLNDLELLTNNNKLIKKKVPFPGKEGSYFNISYSFDFNETEVLLIPAFGIHSDKDILVYFPKDNIVHMGDLLLTESFPAIGFKFSKYLNFLDIILAIFPTETIFVGGHGKELTHSGLVNYKKMLDKTIDVIRQEKESGMGLEQICNKNVLNEWATYGKYIGFITQEFWIECVYKGLEHENLNLKLKRNYFDKIKRNLNK